MAWIAPIAAAAQREREEEEERQVIEELRRNDSDDRYEYKVLRGSSFGFGKAERRQKVMAEEAAFGWEVAATLDYNRLIMRRERRMRELDSFASSGINPYRTETGSATALMIGLMVGLLLLGVAVFLGYFLARGGGVNVPIVSVATIIFIVIMVLMFVVLIMKLRNR